MFTCMQVVDAHPAGWRWLFVHPGLLQSQVAAGEESNVRLVGDSIHVGLRGLTSECDDIVLARIASTFPVMRKESQSFRPVVLWYFIGKM